MRKLFLAAILLLCGCGAGHKYVEGTSLQLGAYVPWESNIYGVELVSYVSGCVVRGATNQAVTIEREYAATNTYFWGMVETRETTRTTVEGK